MKDIVFGGIRGEPQRADAAKQPGQPSCVLDIEKGLHDRDFVALTLTFHQKRFKGKHPSAVTVVEENFEGVVSRYPQWLCNPFLPRLRHITAKVLVHG